MEKQFNQFGFGVIDTLKRNVLLVKETPISDEGKQYCLKLNLAEQEIKLFKDCFPKIDQSKFKKLQLPVAHKVGSLFKNQRWWVLTDYYQGGSIDWNEVHPESTGGRNISLDYVDILAQMLADLKTIDVGIFSKILPLVESASWYKSINQKLTDLINDNLFPSSYQKKATTMLTSGLTDESKKDFILTNGDFQFRNFIELSNHKIVVIDWTKNSFNTPNIEPIEFAAMYQWTLMWANSPWQDAYVKKINKSFNISMDRLRFALLVKSINQAHMWRGNHELSRLQVYNSTRALDGLI